LLLKLLPGLTRIAVLSNPNNPANEHDTREIEAVGAAIGRTILVLRAGTEAEIDAAFASLVEQRAQALTANADPFLSSAKLDHVVALAARYGIPTIYPFRAGPAAGGLVSYGADLRNVRRQAGIYTGRILKGAKPADLPVLQPTKFELVINLKTAKTLGIDIPAGLMAIADEIVE
jgi:putative ABC transport system substrate-binding protein